MLTLAEAADFSDEPEVYHAAQDQVAFERGKCESLLKALRTHVNRHQCIERNATRTATHHA